MVATRWFASPLSLAMLFAVTAAPAQQAQPSPNDAAADLAQRHQSTEWLAVAPHLPDPETATASSLAQAADVLRARRLPEDALDYYRYALRRGGDEASLQNNIGVTLLALNRPVEARIALKRAVQLKPRNAQDWNNLGAAEYVAGSFRAALADYLRAVKLDKKAAVFRSNLGTAYFEMKDYESARQQFEKAVRLDRNVFQESGWAGVEAHVLTATDHGRYCFEMAKMAAELRDDANVIRWLARSTEAGFDVKAEMSDDKDFAVYRKDPRVLTAIQNAHAMRTGQIADSGLEPPLPDRVP